MTAKLTEKPRKTPLPHPARRHLALTPSTSRFAAPPTARFVPVKALGTFVPTLTKMAFEKFGFSTATLVTDWARIAGAELAQYTIPDKLKWPRGGDAIGDEDEGNRRGATLILRVDPACALDVEYRARQIMDRINSYFGYRAVETMKLIQAPLEGKRDPHSARTGHSGAPAPQPPPQTGDGPNGGDPLDTALARLERGVLRDRSTGRRA